MVYPQRTCGLGSGAASGRHNGGGRDGADGGASGGIIILAANTMVFSGGVVTAAGSPGANGYSTGTFGQPMGGGGGGAGGAIWLRSVTSPSNPVTVVRWMIASTHLGDPISLFLLSNVTLR